MRPRAKSGTALLESLVALAILAAAGITTVGVLRGALSSESALRDRERLLARADRVLAAMSLLTASDLDRRLGRHRVGEFAVEVQRPEPALYRLAVVDTAAPWTELLVTVVHRPRAELP